MVFWKELYAGTLNEEQFKDKFPEDLEYGLDKSGSIPQVTSPSLCLQRIRWYLHVAR